MIAKSLLNSRLGCRRATGVGGNRGMTDVLSDSFVNDEIRLDNEVRRSLASWPQRPPGLGPSLKQPGTWLRARPENGRPATQPYLKAPGSCRHRTLPDGMYLHFGPSPVEPYVDILCIEACGTVQNLMDKRARFAPSVNSLLAVCPLDWLLAPAMPGSAAPRWRLIRLIAREPRAPLVLPVRDARVLFGLRTKDYVGFSQTQTAQPHEFFCPMATLIDADPNTHGPLRALIARAALAANFMELPDEGAQSRV